MSGADGTPYPSSGADPALARTLRFTLCANLAMFALEIGVAIVSGSVALTADSIDFLEDASLGALALCGLALAPRWRTRIGTLSAILLLAPTAATLVATWHRLSAPVPPQAAEISLTASAALATNLLCAVLLARHRDSGGGSVRAAFLSARNDVLANLATIAAAGAVAVTRASWPDIAVGLCIGALNAGAFLEVWRAAHGEAPDDD